MKHKRKITIASVLVAGMILTPAFAFLPVGVPVYDASNDLNQTIQIANLVTQLSQAVALYTKTSQMYNQMTTNAKFLTKLSAYRQAVTPWQGMATTNTFGNTAGWIAAVNSGLDTVAAWNLASSPRKLYGLAMSKVPVPQRPQLQAEYATLELQDGTAQAAMGVIGAIRRNGSLNEGALNTLENDTLSTSADLNTELAVLNKINAANLIGARQVADTNKLLVAQAEYALVQAKMQHDAEASAVANDIAFRTTGMATLRAQHAGFAEAMKNFRMP